ncbi:MAG: hypothetical protein JRI98_06950 [Deltaproteobacteria bacterium]|nr:hypothetical protein [Deltaproteobacteria bacterium]
MAETALQETVDEEAAPEAPAEQAPTWREPTTPVATKLASMSDRAIQRVTGGNAFLRGRLYARRKAVENLSEEEHSASGEISVRTADEPYRTQITYTEESDSWESSCTCPGWRGPTGHCKHVAAVMVALRDEVRPPRVKGPQQQSKKKKKTEPVHIPGTVSAGGKRRRSRRRRRSPGGADGGALDVLSPRELQARRGEARGPMDAWLPAEALPKPLEFEYRMTVRPASITVTPVLAGTRSAVPISEALSAFNMVSIDERPLFRALARNVNRGQATTAELRGEDAAEVVEMLSDRRVLLEPASMELRFSNEALKPRIELDPANGDSLRVRVVFYLESNKRRFALSSGAWFEGTPGWQIDTTEGVARPVSELVTPAWLQRLLGGRPGRSEAALRAQSQRRHHRCARSPLRPLRRSGIRRSARRLSLAAGVPAAKERKRAAAGRASRCWRGDGGHSGIAQSEFRGVGVRRRAGGVRW